MENLNLNVQVTGLKKLKELRAAMSSIKAAGKTSGQPFDKASGSAKKLIAAVEKLEKTTATGFGSLNKSVRTLETNLLKTARAANTAAAATAQVGSGAAAGMGQAAGAAGAVAAATGKATTAAAAHKRGIMEMDHAYNTLHTSVRGLAGGLGGLWLSYGRPMAALWAGFAVATGVKTSLSQLAEFSHQMAIVGAVSGESQLEIQKVSERAIEMGSTGIYSANEYASGLRVLAQAGVKASDAIKEIQSVGNLATVGELGLDKSAETLVGISTAFDLPVESLPLIADKIAKTAAISQASVQSLTQSMTQASAVAEQYNISLDTTGALLATLAKRNIVGTKAGVALRNMFKELQAPTQKANQAMRKLGVETFDETTGKAKDVIAVFKEMKVAMAELNERSKQQFLQAVFGERGGKPASAILSDISQVEAAIRTIQDAAGFSTIAAKQVEDSVQGQWKRAMNTLSGTLLKAAADSEPAIRSLITSLRELFESPEFADGIRAIVAGVSEMGTVVAKNFRAITIALTAMTAIRLGAWAATAVAGLNSMRIASKAAAIQQAAQTAATLVQNKAIIESAKVNGTAALSMGALTKGTWKWVVAAARFLPMIGLITAAVYAAGVAFDVLGDKEITAQERLNQAIGRKIEQNRSTADALRAQAAALSAGENRVVFDESSNISAMEKDLADLIKRRDELKANPISIAMGGEGAIGVTNANKAIKDQIALIDQYKLSIDEVKAAQKRLFQAEVASAEKAAAKANADPAGTVEMGFDRSREKPASRMMQEAQARLSVRLKLLSDQTNAATQIMNALERSDGITEGNFTKGIELLNASSLDKEIAAVKGFIYGELPKLAAYGQEQILKLFRPDQAEFTQATDQLNQSLADAKDQAMQQLQSLSLKRQTNTVTSTLRIRQAENARQMKQIKSLQDQEQKQLAKAETLQNKMDTITKGGAGVVESTALNLEKRALTDRVAFETQIVREHAQSEFSIRQSFLKKFAAARALDAGAGRDHTLAVLREQQRESLTLNAQYYQRLDEQRKSSGLGVKQGMMDFVDAAENMQEQTRNTTKGIFDGMSSAFGEFVTNSKSSFSDLSKSILKQLAEMYFKTQLLAPTLKLMLGTGSGIGANSTSGQLNASTGAAGGLDHTGGVVGRESVFRGGLSAQTWDGANKFHTGGVVGEEVPIIAKRGEGVFTKQQMKALGKGSGGAVKSQVNITNNGRPVEAESSTSFDGEQMVTNIILKDLQRNGRIAQTMRGTRR